MTNVQRSKTCLVVALETTNTMRCKLPAMSQSVHRGNTIHILTGPSDYGQVLARCKQSLLYDSKAASVIRNWGMHTYKHGTDLQKYRHASSLRKPSGQVSCIGLC